MREQRDGAFVFRAIGIRVEKLVEAVRRDQALKGQHEGGQQRAEDALASRSPKPHGWISRLQQRLLNLGNESGQELNANALQVRLVPIFGKSRVLMR